MTNDTEASRVVSGHTFRVTKTIDLGNRERRELTCEHCGGVALNPTWNRDGMFCETFTGAPDKCPGPTEDA